MPQPLMLKKLKLASSMKCVELTPSGTNTKKKKKKDVLYVIGVWNAKVESQEIPGVTGKIGLGVQNKAVQSITKFYQEKTLVTGNTLFQQHKR